jgi:uncharacterized small protein (TIGR04563 family)
MATNTPRSMRTSGGKVSLYLPDTMRDSLHEEAQRQDRSISWLMKKAWEVALPTIQRLPSIDQNPDGTA